MRFWMARNGLGFFNFPVIAIWLTALACSSSGTGAASSGGIGSGSSGSGSTGLASSSSSGSSSGTGSWTLSCPMSIASFCATAQHPACIVTWADRPTGSCSGCPIAESSQACGGYNLVDESYCDGENQFYFDAASGALVAVTNFVGDSPTCLAGPSTFDAPISCSTEILSCPDGG
jgi:hypothetical protein